MNQQEYNKWQDDRPSILDALLNNLEKTTSVSFDFTAGSLQNLGEYLVNHYASLNKLFDAKNLDLLVGLSTYAYEVFFRNLNLVPRLPLDNPQYQHFGSPVLQHRGGPDVSPFDLVVLTVQRRDKNLLLAIYNHQVESLDEHAKSSKEKISIGTTLLDDVFIDVSEDEFNVWITFLSDEVHRFIASLHADIQVQINYSTDSLRIICQILAEYIPRLSDIPEQYALFEGVYAYVGEVFHRNTICQYYLPDDPQGEDFGQPSLLFASGQHTSLPKLVFDAVNDRDLYFLTNAFLNFGEQ